MTQPPHATTTATDTGTPPATPSRDGSPSGDGQGGDERRFTQADVDRMIKARATRVAAEQYADYNDLQAKAKRLEELEAANATDTEKAVRKAQEEIRAEITAAANSRILNAEARSLAAEARFRNPTLAVKAIDLAGVKVTDDGTVDASAVRALLDELAKAEPYLVHDDPPTGPTAGAGKPRPDGAQGQNPGAPTAKAAGIAEARRRFGDKTSTTST
ncbi:MAG: hypothetical protein ACRCZP_11780 [Phycicoccus sp.]